MPADDREPRGDRQPGRHARQRARHGFCLIGEGDLSEAFGYPRQYDHPEVRGAMTRIVETCHKHRVVIGNPHTGARNVERLIGEGYKFLMSAPSRSYGVVGQGRELAGY